MHMSDDKLREAEPRLDAVEALLNYDEPMPEVPLDTCVRWLLEFVREEQRQEHRAGAAA
jgi:hypothetical protein